MFRQLMHKQSNLTRLLTQQRVASFSTVKFTITNNSEDKKWEIEATQGESMMTAGIRAGVPFEQACGGKAECCTCQVYGDLEAMKD